MARGDAEADILARVSDILSRHADSSSWANEVFAAAPELRQAVLRILATLGQSTRADMDREEARAAVAAAVKARATARKLAKVAPTPSRSRTPTVIAPPLVKTDLVRDMLPTVMRSTNDILRRVVTEVLIQPVTTEKARLDAVQAALDRLTKAGVTGFVDRGGKRWNMTSYLEMATRTALHRASTDWYAHELSNAGVDLAVVRSRTNSACPSCSPFRGEVLTLSGETRGPIGISRAGQFIEVVASLAEARARGFQHPNCRCYLVPFISGEDYALNQDVDPRTYRDEQQLRLLERNVRTAKTRLATSVTPERQAQAKRDIRAAQGALRSHVEQTGVIRQRNREQLNVPR